MPVELYVLKLFAEVYWTRLQVLRDDERGMTTETVIITALLAACALLAVGLIVQRVQEKANNIQMSPAE